MNAKFNPWPFGIVLTFVIFIAGLATAVGIAVTHRDSMVNENYYEQELKYQSQIDGKARALQSGASINYDSVAGKIIVQLPASQEAAKPFGKIELYRPSSPDMDRVVDFSPSAEGSQVVDTARLAAGSWAVRVKWNAGGQDYFLEQKIAVRSK